MECIACKKRPATFRFTKLIEGKQKELHFCEICAYQHGYIVDKEQTYSLQDLLKALFHIEPAQMDFKQDVRDNEPLSCQHCDLPFTAFQQTGRFGCAHCYDTFHHKIETIFKRVHSGNTKHTGKVPNRKASSLKVQRQIETLREKMQVLVKQEAFEEAAKLRDEIKALQSSEGGGAS